MRIESGSGWRRTLRISSFLLLLWLALNLGLMAAALQWPALLEWDLGGYPLPFLICAQALPLAYLLLCALTRSLLAPGASTEARREREP
ncbi:sodium/substrate symporter small subunit [Massilia sp. W12]|uniref:sodium/substrate symporter small subunit n=1 Tax=Massilia sp. W12 TaxID=3126507 RepID=UPI0030CF5CC2